VDDGVEHRDVEVLTFTRSTALEQCGEDAHGGEGSSAQVGDLRAGEGRFTVSFPAQS
jgi:hypothetical protein